MNNPFIDSKIVTSISYYDVDGDVQTGTETRWYLNNAIVPAYANLTTIPSASVVVGAYMISARVRDAYNWGIWVNDTTTVSLSPTSNSGITMANCTRTKLVIFAAFALFAIIGICVAAFGLFQVFNLGMDASGLAGVILVILGLAVILMIGYAVIGNMALVTCAI